MGRPASACTRVLPAWRGVDNRVNPDRVNKHPKWNRLSGEPAIGDGPKLVSRENSGESNHPSGEYDKDLMFSMDNNSRGRS